MIVSWEVGKSDRRERKTSPTIPNKHHLMDGNSG